MKRITTYVALGLLIITACKHKQPEMTELETNLIEVNKEQFRNDKMAFGMPEQVRFEKSFQFTGKVVPEINGMASLSSSIEGMVETIYVQTGQFVKAGDVILEIGGSPFVELQQAFAKSSAQMQQLKSHFDRTEALYKDNIKTENEFMLAQSAYKSELANYSGLKIKVQTIGLHVANIENGVYAKTFKITSPIDGQVAALHASRGQYISPQQTLAEIVNPDKNQLQLAVFESDYSKIRIGQQVRFRSAGEVDYKFQATIARVSKILNSQSKSFDCFAEIDPLDKGAFIIHQLIRGEVITEADTLLALPQEAIIMAGNNTSVYMKSKENKESYFLEKVDVQVGRSSNGFVEVRHVPKDKMILVSGTYHMGTE